MCSSARHLSEKSALGKLAHSFLLLWSLQAARLRKNREVLQEAYEKDMKDTATVTAEKNITWESYQHAYSIVRYILRTT